MESFIACDARISLKEAQNLIAYMQMQIDEILKCRRERKTAIKRKNREKKRLAVKPLKKKR